MPAAGAPKLEFVSLADVGNVKGAVLAHPAKPWFINTRIEATNGYGTKMSPRNRLVSLVESQQHIINPTNPSGALNNRVHTGWTSVGERLIMPRTSAVAV